jgi:glycosyltransferase involved in cell wall biosynthesis
LGFGGIWWLALLFLEGCVAIKSGMKILHIIYDDIHNPWCGGGGAYRAHRINSFLSKEHEIIVLTGNFPGGKDEDIDGVSYKRIGFCNSYLVSRISFTFLIQFFIKKYESDILVNDCSFFSPCFAEILTKRPIVNIFHHLMGRHSIRIYPITGLLPFLAEKVLLKTAKIIITPSEFAKKQILDKYASKRVTVIPNGVSEKLFELEPRNENFILFLGRIDLYMKGIDILIDAFSKIETTSIVLYIAGGGKKTDLQKLYDLIDKHNLRGRVEYLGRVDRETKFHLLSSCLFLVMPSRFEGWGITGMEANAAGKAVVGTKIQGLQESLVEGKTAILIHRESVKELAEAISHLIKNEEKRAELGRAGRIHARRFSWRNISLKQLDSYQNHT